MPRLYTWSAVTLVPYLLVVVAAAQVDLRAARRRSLSLLRSRPLGRAGHWSYAFYLCHVPVGFVLLRRYGAAALGRHPVAWVAVWLLAAGGLAAVAHRLVELPLYRRAR